MNKKMLDFSTYDEFFGERIYPKFLLFSYVGLFLSIIYLPITLFLFMIFVLAYKLFNIFVRSINNQDIIFF